MARPTRSKGGRKGRVDLSAATVFPRDVPSTSYAPTSSPNLPQLSTLPIAGDKAQRVQTPAASPYEAEQGCAVGAHTSFTTAPIGPEPIALAGSTWRPNIKVFAHRGACTVVLPGTAQKRRVCTRWCTAGNCKQRVNTKAISPHCPEV